MKLLAALAFAWMLSMCTLQPVNIVSSNADEESGYAEGDIMLRPETGLQVADKNLSLQWPDARVYYVIGDAYDQDERDQIFAAMKEFERVSCVRFLPKDLSIVDYIHFRKIRGCSSEVGRQGGEQALSLEGPKCFFKGVIMHELFHALGFWHEHNRPDRDQYVQILFDNVEPGQQIYFEKYGNDSVDLFDISYDYGSILHGSRTMLSKNASAGLETIVPFESGVDIGQRIGFSEKDIRKLNAYYKCDNPSTTTSSYGTSTTKQVSFSTTETTRPSTNNIDPCLLTTGLYYASDPKNCSRFYVCVDGNEVQQQNCPDGLVFNVKLGVCDWPWAYQCNITLPFPRH